MADTAEGRYATEMGGLRVSIDVAAPVDKAYQLWARVDELPTFMDGVAAPWRN